VDQPVDCVKLHQYFWQVHAGLPVVFIYTVVSVLLYVKTSSKLKYTYLNLENVDTMCTCSCV
jgi:hypothetical protein